MFGPSSECLQSKYMLYKGTTRRLVILSALNSTSDGRVLTVALNYYSGVSNRMSTNGVCYILDCDAVVEEVVVTGIVCSHKCFDRACVSVLNGHTDRQLRDAMRPVKILEEGFVTLRRLPKEIECEFCLQAHGPWALISE